MRTASGSNDHPDPTIFLQLFRLIGTYSLIKPPKGSNIEGVELFTSLLQKVDKMEDSPHEKMREVIDNILGNGGDPDEVSQGQDHEYNFMNSPDVVTAYVTGFVARKLSATAKCQSCEESLVQEVGSFPNKRDKLIEIKSKGRLMKASDALFQLVSTIEKCVLETVSNEPLGINSLN